MQACHPVALECFVDSLAIAVGITILVAIWGLLESGRKFRREFRKRGQHWEVILERMAGAPGTLIVDTLWGPQRGLGHPVIWYLPRHVGEGENLAGELQAAAVLVKCPRAMRSTGALRERFGEARVRVHTWSVDPRHVDDRR